MIARLNKEQTRTERRKLLIDPVYILMSDALRQLQKEGKTRLSHVEAFLSARNFADLLFSLGDAEEGIDDELDDLEDETGGTDDAAIIALVASAIMLAAERSRPGTDARPVVRRILDRWVDHPLILPILGSAARKERERKLEGKVTQLLGYEIREAERSGEGEKGVRSIFRYFIDMAKGVDASTIKGILLVMNKYNIDHGHRYDNEIDALYEKLGVKANTQLHFDKLNDIHDNQEVKIGK